MCLAIVKMRALSLLFLVAGGGEGKNEVVDVTSRRSRAVREEEGTMRSKHGRSPQAALKMKANVSFEAHQLETDIDKFLAIREIFFRKIYWYLSLDESASWMKRSC